MKYDLTNIKSILKKLGNPENSFASIQIAGTNGKGATASFIASILMEHGLKVGLFTSPHIVRFNERIRINGKYISNNYIKEFLEKNKAIIKRIKPTFFEVNTAMAFKYFADNEVDIAIVECGLGGRLDSTNVLKPKLSVITQIGMDHIQYLGNTLHKIALEKIGIVKPATDVVVSDNNKTLRLLFKKKIKPEHLIHIDDTVNIKYLKCSLQRTRFILKTDNFKKEKYNIPLPGKFQARNAAAAITSCRKYLQQIGIKSDENKITRGLINVIANTGYRCRLETVKLSNKEFIFDISHNPEGIKETTNSLKTIKIHALIFGMMEDKNLDLAIKEIMKISNNIILTKANYKRTADPETLCSIALKYHSKNHCIIVKENVKDALKLIINENGNIKRILITGSFFIVSDAIKALKIKNLFD